MEFVRTVLMVLAAMSFVIMIGGGIYEHAGIVPSWSAAVPASLTIYQGEYAINAARFWISIHPITLTLFVLALIANWRTERRYFILAPLVGYGLVIVITALYFVPELLAITGTPYSTIVDPVLTQRAKTWEMLSLIRGAFLLVMAVTLLFGLSKSGKTSSYVTVGEG